MKSLRDFESNKIPSVFLKLINGGISACEALDGCIATALRDDTGLAGTCQSVLGPACMEEIAQEN